MDKIYGSCGIFAKVSLEENSHLLELRYLKELVKELESFYKAFWDAGEESWVGVVPNTTDYVADFFENCQILRQVGDEK